MEFGEETPALCPFCGGIRQQKKNEQIACPCTCVECTDGCEME